MTGRFAPGDVADAFDDSAEPPMLKAPDHPMWPDIRQSLMSVYDPDLEYSLYELGLIYDVKIKDGKAGAAVDVTMSLTSPSCFVAAELPVMIKYAVESVKGVETADVRVVFEPQWTKEHMSFNARLGCNLL